MPLLRRIPTAFLFGLLAGWAAGALEAALVTGTSELAFPAPLADSFQVAWRYALAGGVLAVLLALLPKLLRPRHASSFLASTLAVLVFLIGTSWIHQKAFAGLPPWAWGPLVANGVLAGLCLAFGFALGRMRMPAGVVVVLGLAGHGAVVATDARADEAPAAVASAPAPAGSPNVIFLLVDTLRADRLGCYGHQPEVAPVIDRLAAEGMRFERAYAQATWTRPSVASLMTSLHPASHLTNDLHVRVPAEVQTLAETVKTRGYATAGFSANRNVSEIFGFAQGFDTFWTHASEDLNSMLRFTTWERVMEVLRALGLAPGNEPRNEAAVITDEVLRWADRQDDSPFLLYVQYIDPHGPYEPPAAYLAERGLQPLPEGIRKLVNVAHGAEPYPLNALADVEPEVVADVLELYDAEISYCDREIGRLLDGLRDRGLLDGAYLILTSDHGEEFYEHKQFGHGQSAFEELAHVPLIIKGPGISPGVVDQPVELLDLYPTIATWIGAALPERLQGHDLGDLIAGGSRPAAAEALITNIKGWELDGWVFGHEKLVRIEVRGEVHWMLFDLATDPGELHDLAPLQPERLEELKSQLLQRREGSARFRVGTVDRVDLGAERGLGGDLSGLGYVGDDAGGDSQQ